jgi:hypothetical protein
MRMIPLTLLMAGFIAGCVPAVQAQQECTQDEANQADQGIDTLSTWSQVYASFSLYGQCDDGAIAEGYDDKVVALLVTHWDSIRELVKLSSDHPLFEKFVLNHIDTLMSPDQARAIIENAGNHCPVEAKEFCAKLENEVRKEIQEVTVQKMGKSGDTIPNSTPAPKNIP